MFSHCVQKLVMLNTGILFLKESIIYLYKYKN